MIARTHQVPQAKHLPNIVLTAAMHTPLPLWVRLCRAASLEARQLYLQERTRLAPDTL